MHELTTYELDAQLAEQLPARELMGRSYCRPSSPSHGSTTTDQTAAAGNGNGDVGLVNVSGNSIALFGSSAGNNFAGNYAG
jgi:hypothetical protein